MASWADVSSTNRIEHSSLDVNLADFDPNYDPSYDLEAACPMCRTQTRAIVDEKLAERLQQKYPATYEERRVEEEIESGSRVGQDGIEGVMILIGNKHRLVRGADDANQHDWTFFVRTSRPDLVKQVRIELHPTFRPPRVVLRNPPFEVRRLGWGVFTIEAEIVLKDPYSWIVDNSGSRQTGLELVWMLDFEGRGRQGRVRAKVKKMVQQTIASGPDLSDEDNEEDEDFEADDRESSSEDEDEDMTDGIETFIGAASSR